jgi:hypothetical protein
MANTVNTIKNGPGLFAKGVAERLRDNLQLCKFVSKADSSEYDAVKGHKPGDTIYTTIPTRKIVQQDNLDVSSYNGDIKEEKAALVLNKTATTADSFDSLELATDIDVARALERFGMPAADSLAHSIESRCFGIVADKLYNSAGTPGSNNFTTSDVLASRTRLARDLCPQNDRMLFLNSASGAKAVDARKGVFQSSEKIAEQYEMGYMGRADGFEWIETEMVPSHTNGADQTGGAINDASVAEGSTSITVDGFSTAVTVGSVFTIAGVFKVHPITKQTMVGVLQQFVVTSATTTEIGISPALYASATDPRKNVSALPADDAALVFVGGESEAFIQNIALHKSAFKMVTVPLYTPKGEELVATETVDGITVNIVRYFDGNTRVVKTRYDVLYGFDAVRPEWGCALPA